MKMGNIFIHQKWPMNIFYKESNKCNKYKTSKDIYVHRNEMMGEKLPFDRLNLTTNGDKFNCNIWTVTVIWEATRNGEKRGITESDG